MSKVVCDICGTVYPESSENCPVCGCSRDFGLDAYEEEFLLDAAESIMGSQSYPNTKKKNREIFDFDEVNQEDEPEEEEEYFEEDEEQSGSNTVLVIILLVLIVLLLLTAGFFFVRYFLPNMVQEETEPTETTVATLPVETEPVITDELTVPCTDIVVPGGKIELGKDGKWLMNVQVYPVDTTDVLTYASHDESIVTVDENGTVTAVGEGTTIIEVSCGIQTIKCNVVVDYSAVEATEPVGTIPAPQAEQATDATDPTAQSAPAETEAATETTVSTEATEALKETTGNTTELKLKKADITMFARYSSVDLELDCDIPAESIKWFTMDSTVAIVHNGTVTATGSGMTRIYAEYNGQQVQCIVRCTF